MDFGKQIRQIRKDAKLTQEQMAAKLNVSRQAVSNWENNKNLPYLLCIGVLCILLKAVSVEYIDAQGVLHENFFLLPIGFLFIFSGMITFAIAGVRRMVLWIKGKRCKDHTTNL